MCFFSGCTQESSDSDDDTTNGDTTSDSIVINIFQVTPSLINYGETANLSWKVTGATAVEINQDIGSLPLEGSRIINPTEEYYLYTYCIKYYNICYSHSIHYGGTCFICSKSRMDSR